MENIKLYTLVNNSIAIDVKEASLVSSSIIERYKKSQGKVTLDFGEIQSLISPFMRALLKPLIINDVTFEGVNFTNTRSENIYNRVLNELQTIGTENIKELQE